MTNAPSGDPRDRSLAGDADAPPLSPSPSPSPSPRSSDPSASRLARDRLASALDVASRLRQNADTTGPLSDVRGAVYAYIAALREDRATIEQAVIATKELAWAALGNSPATPERRALAEQVVRWGIDAYYEGAVRAD